MANPNSKHVLERIPVCVTLKECGGISGPSTFIREAGEKFAQQLKRICRSEQTGQRLNDLARRKVVSEKILLYLFNIMPYERSD